MHSEIMRCEIPMAGDSQYGWKVVGILENGDLRAAIDSSFLADGD